MAGRVPGYRRHARWLLGIALFICTLLPVSGQATGGLGGSRVSGEESPFREPSLAEGAPFSLNAYDAVHALYLLRRTLFLRVRRRSGQLETVRIREVRALRLKDAPNPLTPFERKRYDILVNGERIDWANSFIEYDEREINLRLLYTYRNGGLPEGLRYTP